MYNLYIARTHSPVKASFIAHQSCTVTVLSMLAIFLAATKQLYKWYFPSVRLSVHLSHLFDYIPIIVSSWNFQELLPMTKVRSMQKVKVKGHGHSGHNPT